MAYAAGAYSASSRASAVARGSSSSGVTTSSTQPSAAAVDTSTVPAPNVACVTDVPIAYRQISSADIGNIAPTASSVSPIVPADISRMSAAIAKTQPPAMAWPLTAATTGAGWSKTARNAADSDVMKRSVYWAPPSTIAGRSTPAEKHRPSPVSTTGPSSPHMATMTSSSRSRSSALTGGWSNRTTETPSTSSMLIARRSFRRGVRRVLGVLLVLDAGLVQARDGGDDKGDDDDAEGCQCRDLRHRNMLAAVDERQFVLVQRVQNQLHADEEQDEREPLRQVDQSLEQVAEQEVQLPQAHQRENVRGEHQVRLLGQAVDRGDRVQREDQVGGAQRDDD